MGGRQLKQAYAVTLVSNVLPFAYDTLLAVSDALAAVTGHGIVLTDVSATDPEIVHGEYVAPGDSGGASLPAASRNPDQHATTDTEDGSIPHTAERPAATMRGQPSSGLSQRKYVVGGAWGSRWDTVGHWALEL